MKSNVTGNPLWLNMDMHDPRNHIGRHDMPQAVNSTDNRRRHEWNDEGICIHCGYDGADAAWQQTILKAEIGPDEFKFRMNAGEFDSDRFCP